MCKGIYEMPGATSEALQWIDWTEDEKARVAGFFLKAVEQTQI